MMALSGLNSVSALLQQIVSDTRRSADQKPDATVSIVRTDAGVSPATGSAAKSVSSAIFNAVMATSEKQDRTIGIVLDYIDREYADVDETSPSVVALAAEQPTLINAIAKHKAEGDSLKLHVLADSEGTLKMIDQIKDSRSDISQGYAIGLMIAELGSRAAR